MDRKGLGKYLKGKRLEAGLTQHGASALMGYRSNGTVNTIEQGINPIPIERVFDFSEIYKIPINDLLGKLKECDPERHELFMALQWRFERLILSKMMGYAEGESLHKFPYKSQNSNFSKSGIYIIRHFLLNIPPVPADNNTEDISIKSIPFSLSDPYEHARAKRVYH